MAFEPSHVVPEGGLPAWNAPDGTQPVAANLAAGTELRVVEWHGGWARVEAANGWSGWLDGGRLAATTGSTAVTEPVAAAAAPLSASTPSATSTLAWRDPNLGQARAMGREILLFIVTFGFYGFVWTFKTLDEIGRHTGKGVGGLGGLVGGHPFISIFLVPYEVRKMYELDRQQSPVSGRTGFWFLLLPIVGAFIWFSKVQGGLNAYWVSKGAPAP